MTDGAALRGDRFLARLVDAVGTAVVGADEPLRLLAVTVIADGHALLEDVPGVGKTLIARAFAGALGLTFARIQGTPDLLPTDVTGASILERGDFRFVPGPIFANVAARRRDQPRDAAHAVGPARGDAGAAGVGRGRDAAAARPVPRPRHPEPDRAGGHVRAARGAARPLPRAHPARLPGGGGRATDRAPLPGRGEPLDAVTTVAQPEALVALREAARTVRVAPEVEDYIVDLVRATRQHADVRLGASPRASVALYRAAQAAALLDGRDFVLPDDVRLLAAPVLEHRILLDIDRELRGATATAVIADVLDSIELQVEPQEAAAAGDP